MPRPHRSPSTQLPAPSEADVARTCVAWLASQGVDVHRRNVGALRRGNNLYHFGAKGQSDYWFLHPARGWHCELEIKRRGRKPTTEQIIWLLRINLQGGRAWWVDDWKILRDVYPLIGTCHHVALDSNGDYGLDVLPGRAWHTCRAALEVIALGGTVARPDLLDLLRKVDRHGPPS